MIKVNLTTLEAVREPIPQFLNGLKPESLQDLSWTDETLGVANYGYWNEADVTPVLTDTQVYDGTETLVADGVNKVVNVTKGIREKTDEELQAERKALVPQVISMRQARLALLQSGLLQTVTDAINNGTDEALKIEWEYATEVKRDWTNLITMATALGINEVQLDELFILGGKL